MTDMPNIYYEAETDLSFRRIYGAPCMTCTDDDCPGWICKALKSDLPPGLETVPEDPDELRKYQVSCSLYKSLWQIHYVIAEQEPDEQGAIYQQLKDVNGSDVLGPYLLTAIRFYGLWRVFGWQEMKDKILVGYSAAAKDHLRHITANLSNGMEMQEK